MMLSGIINLLKSPIRLYYCIHDWMVTCKVYLCNRLGISVIGNRHSQEVDKLLSKNNLKEKVKKPNSVKLLTAHAQLIRHGTWISGQTLDLLLTIFERAFPEAKAHHYSNLTMEKSQATGSTQKIAEFILAQKGQGLFFIPFVDPRYHHVTMIIVDVAQRTFTYYDSKNSRDPEKVQIGVDNTCLPIKQFCQAIHTKCGWGPYAIITDFTEVRDQQDAHNCGIHVALKALRFMSKETEECILASPLSSHQTIEADRAAIATVVCQDILTESGLDSIVDDCSFPEEVERP